MSTSLFSLIFAGVLGVGTFAGTLQQNLAHPQAPEIDRLFWEIEEDIRKFSNENPLTKTVADEIKKAGTSSAGSQSRRKRRNVESGEQAESKHTLSVWTTLWVGLINNYVRCLWATCKQNFAEKILKEKQQTAIEKANNANSSEIKKFKEKLRSAATEIESIYKKMKDFVLKIEFPENYQYNSNDYPYGPYENYVEEISKNNK